MRIILVTGKGGVGKTTTAAATALACAQKGLRTLVMSTDPAHSLADAFAAELGDEPVEVAPRCRAQQLDARRRMEATWGDIRDYLRELFDWAGVDRIEAEELAVLPGLDEIFALTDVKTHATGGELDALVVDCAPTAETIRFLSLPDLLGWYMERLFPVSRRLTRVVGPVVSRLGGGVPVAGDRVFAATERLHERLDGVREILRDRERSSVRLVVNPERMVVAEARRTFTYLSLFGYRVDAVVANRLLPVDVTDPWFDAWRRTQAEQLQVVRDGFAPVPVLEAPLAAEEIVGVDRLRAFAADLYGRRDPAAVLHHAEPFALADDGDGPVLRMDLPFASRDEVDVARAGDELVVTVGPHRRTIVLPDSLARRSVASAGLRDGVLRVRFGSGGERMG